MARIIDITPPVRSGMAVFPGDAQYRTKNTFAIGPECPVNVAEFSMSAHCGAHADAPLHYDGEGASIDALGLEDFIGPARVIDARGKGPLCLPEDIEEHLLDVPPRVLLRLETEVDYTTWRDDFRALAPETVGLLHEKGVKLVGVDVPSVDPASSKDLAAHMAFLRHDMRILENLALNLAESGDFELIALPLKLQGLDAAPVRAVLRTID
ncbi:arylformamidase [Rhizobiales bacterium]|uniref:arylformamidase n=1 Tax=Hongsoonwoonella zoysiae TaxID=2821844 RepID=UPI00155FBDA6|nr:arylformamidase [Hongsoonwoonella zoysiae]NRG19966.1 arylformamidase [Hongsoonwoonella zoysiae]